MNLPALLLALSIVESDCNDHAVGKLGEVSRYQIKPSLWKTYFPLSQATNPKNAEIVATAIIKKLSTQLETDSVLLISAAYNYGTWRIIKVNCDFSKLPLRVRNYSLRVHNLYHIYDKLNTTTISPSPVSRNVLSSIRKPNRPDSKKLSKPIQNSTSRLTKSGNNNRTTSRRNAKSVR